jgi:hypothetical protein
MRKLAHKETRGGVEKMSELDPTPELPDDTPIERVRFPTRIRNVLDAAGLRTVGDVREISDDTLLSFQDFGKGSVALLRDTLGLPSCDGVRPDRRWGRSGNDSNAKSTSARRRSKTFGFPLRAMERLS